MRMYARLVVGMQSQCINSGYVHPLTRKSLEDILKTKQADQDELENSLREGDEDQWRLSLPEGEENDGESVDSPRPCQPMAALEEAPTIVKTPSYGSMISNVSQDEEEDDECLFSLEL